MIITCGECNSSFKLDNKLIKPDGSKVRCSNCKEVFVVYPEAPEVDAVAVPDLGSEGSGLPHEDTSHDPDLSFAVENISETELEFSDDELVFDKSQVMVTAGEEARLVREAISDELETELDISGLSSDASGAAAEELDFSELDLNDTGLAEAEEELDFSDLELDLDEAGPASDEEELDFSDLELELDLDEAGPAAAEEELDFSDLELELDEAGPAAAEEELDFSDLELELDLDEAGPAAAEEELDFSDLELELDGVSVGTDSGDLQVSGGGAAGDDLNLALFEDEEDDLFADEPELELAGDEDLDFSDIEEMLESEDEDSLDNFSATDDSELEFDLDLDYDLDSGSEEGEELELSLDDDQYEIPKTRQAPPPLPEITGEETIAMAVGLDDGDLAIDDGAGKKAGKPEKTGFRTGTYFVALVLILMILLSAAALYLFKNTVGRAIGITIPVIGFMEDLKESVGDMGIPYLSEIAKPEIKDPEGTIHLSTMGVTGKFVSNTTSGDLFVITGRVKNDYEMTRSTVALTGNLYSANKQRAKTKKFYAGNLIPDAELETLDIKVINMRLGNRLGDKSVNARIRPGQIVDFMVVFDQLPNDLAEFTIEPASSLEGAAIR